MILILSGLSVASKFSSLEFKFLPPLFNFHSMHLTIAILFTLYSMSEAQSCYHSDYDGDIHYFMNNQEVTKEVYCSDSYCQEDICEVDDHDSSPPSDESHSCEKSNLSGKYQYYVDDVEVKKEKFCSVCKDDLFASVCENSKPSEDDSSTAASFSSFNTAGIMIMLIVVIMN